MICLNAQAAVIETNDIVLKSHAEVLKGSEQFHLTRGNLFWILFASDWVIHKSSE